MTVDPRDATIASLTAQLSAMTQERDAHGAEREEAGKRLMDCQYKLADLTAKLTAATDEISMTQQELDDLDAWKARATTAESALREALKFARDLSDKYYHDYKRGDKRGDSYTEGKSDAADEIAMKIAALSAAPQPKAPQLSRQKRVLSWALESFGPIALNRDERAARLVEEAIEVCQAEGLDPAIIQRILDRVYVNPPGDLYQEIGGLAITLDALAENAGISVTAEADREYTRITSKPKEWWQAKHAAKVAAGTANLTPTPTTEKCPKCGGKGTICSVTGLTYSFCVCLDCDRGPVSTEVDCPACHGTGWKVQHG